MDQLDRDRGSEAELGRGAQHCRRFAQQEGPQALAAIERAVAHRRDQAVGRQVRIGEALPIEQGFERALDIGGVLDEFLVERCHGGALPETGENH
jgi:hypothetical protein